MSDSVTLWTIARQAYLSMGFSRQEYWSRLPFPSPGDLPDSGIEPRSPALQAYPLSTEPLASLQITCHRQQSGDLKVWKSNCLLFSSLFLPAMPTVLAVAIVFVIFFLHARHCFGLSLVD